MLPEQKERTKQDEARKEEFCRKMLPEQKEMVNQDDRARKQESCRKMSSERKERANQDDGARKQELCHGMFPEKRKAQNLVNCTNMPKKDKRTIVEEMKTVVMHTWTSMPQTTAV